MAETSSQPISVITGGAGFLGSHLTDRLLAEGHRVIAIDSLITGNVANIEHLAGNKNYKFICSGACKRSYRLQRDKIYCKAGYCKNCYAEAS